MRKFLLLAVALLTTAVGSAQDNWRVFYETYNLPSLLEEITNTDWEATPAQVTAWRNITSNLDTDRYNPVFGTFMNYYMDNPFSIWNWQWELVWDTEDEEFVKYRYTIDTGGNYTFTRLATFDEKDYSYGVDLAVDILNERAVGYPELSDSDDALYVFTQNEAFPEWYARRYPGIAVDEYALRPYWDALVVEAHNRGVPLPPNLDDYPLREGTEYISLADLDGSFGNAGLDCATDGNIISNSYFRVRFDRDTWNSGTQLNNMSTKLDLAFHEFGHQVFDWGHPSGQEIMSSDSGSVSPRFVGGWINPDVWVPALYRYLDGTNQVHYSFDTTTCTLTIIPEIEDDITLDFGVLEETGVTTFQATEGADYVISASYSGTVEEDYGLTWEWYVDGSLTSTATSLELNNIRFTSHEVELKVYSLNGARPTTFGPYTIDVLEDTVYLEDINITSDDQTVINLVDGHINIYTGNWFQLNASAKEGTDITSLQWILENRPERNTSRVPGQLTWRFCCRDKTSPLTLRVTREDGLVVDFDFTIQSHPKPDFENNLSISIENGSYDIEDSKATVQVDDVFKLFFNYTGPEPVDYSISVEGDSTVNRSTIDNILEYSFTSTGTYQVAIEITTTTEGLVPVVYNKTISVEVVDVFNEEDLSFSITGVGTSIEGSTMLVQVGEWFQITATHEGNQPDTVLWAINGRSDWNRSPHVNQLWWRFSGRAGTRTLTYNASRNGIQINKTFTLTAIDPNATGFDLLLGNGAVEGETVDGVTTVTISSCPPNNGSTTVGVSVPEGVTYTGYSRISLNNGATWHRVNSVNFNLGTGCGFNWLIELHVTYNNVETVKTVRINVPRR